MFFLEISKSFELFFGVFFFLVRRKKLETHLVPSLDELDGHLLARGAVGAELDEAKGAGVERADLLEGVGDAGLERERENKEKEVRR